MLAYIYHNTQPSKAHLNTEHNTIVELFGEPHQIQVVLLAIIMLCQTAQMGHQGTHE